MTRDNFQDQTKVLAQSNAFQPGVGGRRGMHHQEFAGEIYAGQFKPPGTSAGRMAKFNEEIKGLPVLSQMEFGNVTQQ